jgi:hypothetical protein
MPQGGQDFDR